MPIPLPDDSPDVPLALARAAVQLGLVIALDSTLRAYPGCRHWHLRRTRAPGTLEVTWWPAERRAWVSMHANRGGDGWVADTAPVLAAAIERELAHGP